MIKQLFGVNPKTINNNANFLYDNIKTHWLAQGYFNDFFHQKEPNIKNILNYIKKIEKYSPHPHFPLLLPIGGDHLNILVDSKNKIKKINKELDEYEIILTSPFEYFKKVKFENKISNIEFLDNSNTYILQGVYSTRIPQKIKNALIQNELSRIVEPFNYYEKDKYNKNIELIYETLIKNHAHDGIYGCSTDSVANAVDYRFEKCENALLALKKRLIGNFKKKYNIQGKIKDKIGLLNLSNLDNIKTVEFSAPYIVQNAQVVSKRQGFLDELLYDINKIPITQDITTIYTQVVEISKNTKFNFSTVEIKKPKKIVNVSENSIENNYIKLSVNNNKIEILNKKDTKLGNKKANKKIYLTLVDTKDDGDSYNYSPNSKPKTLELKKTKVLYDGNIQSCLRLIFKNINLDVILDNQSEFLKFSYEINNKEKNHKIQAVFILENNISKTISKDAIGIIERKIDYNYNMKDYIPAQYPLELKTNEFPMQGMVNANNSNILTKGLCEYEIYKNELKICLLRAVGTISNPKNKTRAIPAGPDLKIPNAQCLDLIKGEFAYMFGDYKRAFLNYDLLFKNYIIINGSYEKELNINFDTIATFMG